MHIVIVGNGPAALSAVEAIREKDEACDITILSLEAERAYTPCFLAKHVAGKIESDVMALKCDDFYESHRVELISGQAVTAVVPQDNAVVLADGSRVHYDKLLLACGADPVIPDSPDLSGEGIFVFKSFADADRIRARAQLARHVVVLGSGFVAMEIAEALAETGGAVTVVARTDRILRRIFDPEVAGMVEEHMCQNGVSFAKGRDLVGVERAEETGDIKAIVLSDGERLPCDMLVVGVGMRPNVGIVAGTSVATDRGILTDDAMRTSEPNIYAAGDVAVAEIAGVRKASLIHPNATATGRIAGYNMVGAGQRMSAHIADMNVLTLFGHSFFSAGSMEGERVLRRAVGADGLVKVFADGAGLITGVELVGDVTRAGLYASLIARGVTVDAVPGLLEPTFNYAQTLGRTTLIS